MNYTQVYYLLFKTIFKMTRVKILVLIFFLFFVSQQLFSQYYRYQIKGNNVIKSDQQQNVIWSAEIFEAKPYVNSTLLDLVIDENNEILIGGRFGTPIDVDPGAGVVEINPGDRVSWFFLKLDENGQFLWVKVLSPNTYETFKISIDNQGNYYIYGLFRAATDFDPGLEEYIVSPRNNNSTGYVLKLNTNGLFEWVKQVPSEAYANVKALEFDSNQDMIVVGSFLESVDLNPDENVNYQLNSNAPIAVYVAKWNSDGNFIWAKSYDGDKPVYPQYISIDKQDNLLIGGFHEGGLIDLDPGNSEFLVKGNGDADIYIQKLNTNGDFLWAKSIGGTNRDDIDDIKTDINGNVIISGLFQYLVNFDPENDGSIYNTTVRYRDFIQKYAPDGSLIWTRVFNTFENVGSIYLTQPNEETIISSEVSIPNKTCFDNLEYKQLIIDDLDNMKASESIVLSEINIENSEQLHIIAKEVLLEKKVYIDKNSNVLIEARSGCD